MLTVFVATYNGAHTLPRSLDAYCRLQSPEGSWRLVIVDNGSSDETKHIIDSFSDRLPLTYIFEPARGKNSALNSGLSHLQGDLAVFTDDDVLPKPAWLVELRRAADSHGSFSIFGGTVVPSWEAPPEDWILRQVPLGPVFAATDPSWKEGPIAPQFVFGTNMALRAEVFQRGYRFNTEIGPRGRNYSMGSETELTLKLAKAGLRAWHCPQAVVEHIVRKPQLTREWILLRARNFGRGQYRLGLRLGQKSRKFRLGFPKWLIRPIVGEGMRAGYARLMRDPEKCFQHLWNFNYLLGQATEARALRVKRKSSFGRNTAAAKKAFVAVVSRQKAISGAARTVASRLSGFRSRLGTNRKRLSFFGLKHKCPFCYSRLRKFLPFGFSFPVLEAKHVVGAGRRQNALCPVCNSSDRERLVYLYCLSKTEIFRAPSRLLHIAPEQCMANVLMAHANIDYVSADLESPNAMVRMDLTALALPERSFDAIICNHVLEHVADDAAAMRELYRVLKPGGWAILQVPISLSLDATYEDFSIKTASGREEAFGQNDHVRIYAKDYETRLSRACFEVKKFQWVSEPEDFGGAKNLFGLNKEECVYVASKARGCAAGAPV